MSGSYRKSEGDMCGYFVAVDFSMANCFILHILEAVILS
jgi:hypothetical protein